MAAVPHKLSQLVQGGIAGDIQWRHDDHLVVREVRALGKHEIDAHIAAIEGAIELLHDGVITRPVAELHELDPVMRIAAVKNRDFVGAFEIHQLEANPLELMGRSGHFVIGAARLKVVREHALPIRLLPVVKRVPVPILDHIGTG